MGMVVGVADALVDTNASELFPQRRDRVGEPRADLARKVGASGVAAHQVVRAETSIRRSPSTAVRSNMFDEQYVRAEAWR